MIVIFFSLWLFVKKKNLPGPFPSKQNGAFSLVSGLVAWPLCVCRWENANTNLHMQISVSMRIKNDLIRALKWYLRGFYRVELLPLPHFYWGILSLRSSGVHGNTESRLSLRSRVFNKAKIMHFNHRLHLFTSFLPFCQWWYCLLEFKLISEK